MDIKLNIDDQFSEETIIIQSPKLSAEMADIIQYIQRKQAVTLYGKRGDALYPLQIDQIIRFYSENRAVLADDTKGQMYQIDARLYQLEEQLSQDFIRISKSEIIHINHIESLQLNPNGMIQLNLANNIQTYSSRHYLQAIKERLKL